MNRQSIRNKIVPFTEFLKNEAIAGILLVVVTIFALLLTNLSTGSFFTALLQSPIHIGISGYNFSFSILEVINDGLMVLFFFVVGLEIKRELLSGELSGFKKALLPMIGAVGGMALPAVIYLIGNAGKQGQSGWAIPVATDIAFVVGILVLLKDRIPTSLRVFLTALAIVDDIGAVIIIAIFYTASISLAALGIALLFFMLLLLANYMGIKSTTVYILLGIGLWLAVLQSGIHPTIAGVILAFTIPTKSKLNTPGFIKSTKRFVDEIASVTNKNLSMRLNEEQLEIIQALEQNCRDSLTPLQRFEINLHPWVTYFIIPLFALANAGVVIGGNMMTLITDPVCLGVIIGLFAGKQLGIFLFSYIAIRLKISEIPAGTSMKQLYGASVLGGVGFTMSLFIAGLSFPGSTEFFDTARIGIFIASILSGGVGYTLLRISPLGGKQE